MNIELTGKYLVNKVLKKSKARYAEGVEEGDIIKFVLEMVNTTGASNGNYVLYADMYVNGDRKTNISQNEFHKLVQILELSPTEKEINKEGTNDIVKIDNKLQIQLKDLTRSAYKLIMTDIINANHLNQDVNLEILANIAEIKYKHSKIYNHTSILIEFVYFGTKYSVGLGHRLQEEYTLYKGDKQYVIKSTNTSIKRAFSIAKNVCMLLRLTENNFSEYSFQSGQDYFEATADGLDRFTIKNWHKV